MYDYSQENAEKEKIKAELNKFNWGALCFGWIWALCNGAWNDYFPTLLIMIAVAAITKIPLIGPVFRILCPAITIYVGTKGNEWAYYGTKKWESLESFVEVQKKWGVASIIYVLCALVFISISVFVFINYDMNNGKEKDINKEFVESLIEDDNFHKLNSGEEITKYLIEIDPNMYSKFSEDCVVVKSDDNEEYVMKVFRYGTCSLERYNCYVLYHLKDENIITPVLKTFFDEQGKLKHQYVK